MTSLLFLIPLIVIVITAIAVWFIVVPSVNFLPAQVPSPIPPSLMHIPKSPPMDECAHGSNNQTLDSGILCTPKDLPLMKQYRGNGAT